ncbi:hypothetical protein BVF91_11540 [Thermoanaerobacterium sp. PSU-2]|uniref:hypothetical protein n=1 Tax=Thermoanaerobacterium sp. PSU-2 TaxID=1930849 RepID=UPI000A14DA6C|nr:hypothetical protein [Thermoanaerobacterium sp. PSU-2]ORX22466.1 hypothetical protein BVF91_11540 [Thermoanaerobacterium sp. PSU-2]
MLEGNTLAVLTLVIGLVIGVVATVGVVIPLLKKKGIDIEKYLNEANDTVVKVDQVFDTIKPFLPQVPALGIIDKVLEYTKLGVDKAEQLYHIGQIQADQRKAEAKSFILDALKLAKIDVTPELDKVIDGAIEASVMALGHTQQTAQAQVAATTDTQTPAAQTTTQQ